MSDVTAFPPSYPTDLLDRFVDRSTPIVHPILGRAPAIEQVRALLDGDGVRVVSLLGPGGVGKTRLALEVMRQAGGDFAHGACFVPLAPVRDHALVPFAVAQALGIQESGDLSITDLLAAWLRPRHFLLALDNLEQVIGAASPWLVELLASCPRLTVLVTSRIALNVTGEQRYRVPPLPVPESLAPARLEEYASVALFAQRAHALRADFVLDGDNTGTVAAICARLDGLPLAIELAAARITVFSAAEILARLTDRLSLLTAHVRDAPPRLRSLRDAIGWSYDLLHAEEQELFCRLAVFVGGFPLEAAEVVAGGQDGALDVLAALIDQSLVERIEGGSVTRYRMLETIREFGIAELVERDELDLARDAHAAYYQQLAVTAEKSIAGSDPPLWHWLVEAEHGNLREALDWLTTSNRIPEAVELFHHIQHYLMVRGHFTECRYLLDGWFASGELDDRSRSRALALDAEGALLTSVEAIDSPIPSLDEALDIFRELGDRRQVMHMLGSLSFSLRVHGDLERARAANGERIALARDLSDARSEALAFLDMATIAGDAGDVHGARVAFEATLAIARQEGMLLAIAFALGALGDLALNVDRDPGRARELLEETRSIREKVGDRRNMPFAYISLADVERTSGNYGLAHAHLFTAMSIAREIGLSVVEGGVLVELARVSMLRGDPVIALQELRQAVPLLLNSGHHPAVADCLDLVADVALHSGDAPSAARFLGAADGMPRNSDLLHSSCVPDYTHDAVKERVRAALGEEAFARCHAEGGTWSHAEAVAAALAFEPNLATADQPGKVVNPYGLSPREFEVLRLMANGLSNQQIADALYLSRRTVTSHASSILGKLNLASRTQASPSRSVAALPDRRHVISTGVEKSRPAPLDTLQRPGQRRFPRGRAKLFAYESSEVLLTPQ